MFFEGLSILLSKRTTSKQCLYGVRNRLVFGSSFVSFSYFEESSFFQWRKPLKAKEVWVQIFYFLIVLYGLPQIWVCLCPRTCADSTTESISVISVSQKLVSFSKGSSFKDSGGNTSVKITEAQRHFLKNLILTEYQNYTYPFCRKWSHQDVVLEIPSQRWTPWQHQCYQAFVSA